MMREIIVQWKLPKWKGNEERYNCAFKDKEQDGNKERDNYLFNDNHRHNFEERFISFQNERKEEQSLVNERKCTDEGQKNDETERIKITSKSN